MKIKRFVAQDMRQALRMVRETLGEDAVILSNKSVDGGVEITAAVDLVDGVSGDTVDQRIPTMRWRPRAVARGRRRSRRRQVHLKTCAARCRTCVAGCRPNSVD